MSPNESTWTPASWVLEKIPTWTRSGRLAEKSSGTISAARLEAALVVGAGVVGVGSSDPPVQAAAIRMSDTTSAAVGRARTIALILSYDGTNDRPTGPLTRRPHGGAAIACVR